MDGNRGCALNGESRVFPPTLLLILLLTLCSIEAWRPVERIETIICGIPVLLTGHAKNPAQHVFDEQHYHCRWHRPSSSSMASRRHVPQTAGANRAGARADRTCAPLRRLRAAPERGGHRVDCRGSAWPR